jgi:hypothetical protein
MSNIKSFEEHVSINEGGKMRGLKPGEFEKIEAKNKSKKEEEKEMLKDIKAKLHPNEWKFIEKYIKNQISKDKKASTCTGNIFQKS